MKCVALPFAVIVAALQVVAQEPLKPVDPPELVARKAEHLRAMRRVQIAPLTSYIQSLNALRQQYAREAKLEAVVLVDAEIKNAKEQLNTANAAIDITTAAPTQLQIDQAVFGDLQRNRVADVTAYIKKAFDAGQSSVSISRPDMLGAGDPAPGVHKSTRITYTINGKRKIREFKDGLDAVLDFKKDLR